MYETHFRLRGRPFRAAPDTTSYYPATSHERALAQLLQTLADDEGVALLTGGPGTGKTLLCHGLLERLGPETTSAFLTHSHFPNRAGFLQAVLYDFSLPYEGRGEQEMRLALTDHLLQNFAAEKRNLLILDEAQNLIPDVLEELRLLGNLEGSRGKALQVVLAGQPPLLENLRRPELAAFAQRVAVRPRLEPLGLHEAADYLVHHLRAAGARPEDVIVDEALEILARGTGGVPRLLNRAAHQALTLAAAAAAAQVDAEAALEALALLGLAEPDEEVPAEGSDFAPSAGRLPDEPEGEEAEDGEEARPHLLGGTGHGNGGSDLGGNGNTPFNRLFPPQPPRRPA